MNNQSQSDGIALKDVSDASMKKGKFSLLGCGCQSIVSVLGIIIVLSIIMPFPISDAKKAKQSEAKQYVGSMNRAQQVKFAENRVFANSVDELGLGMKTETSSVRYSVKTTNKTAFHYGLSKDEKFKSYVGAVFLVTNNYTKETSTLAISCVTKSPTKTQPPNPILDNGNPTCANATDPVTR